MRLMLKSLSNKILNQFSTALPTLIWYYRRLPLKMQYFHSLQVPCTNTLYIIMMSQLIPSTNDNITEQHKFQDTDLNLFFKLLISLFMLSFDST